MLGKWNVELCRTRHTDGKVFRYHHFDQWAVDVDVVGGSSNYSSIGRKSLHEK